MKTVELLSIGIRLLGLYLLLSSIYMMFMISLSMEYSGEASDITSSMGYKHSSGNFFD
jgi:hypothetical protein